MTDNEKQQWNPPTADKDTAGLAGVTGGQNTWNGNRYYDGRLIQSVGTADTGIGYTKRPVIYFVSGGYAYPASQ